MASPDMRPLLPEFVRTYLTLGAFWPFIKSEAGKYAGRWQIIVGAFTPLLDQLEGVGQAPGDLVMSEALSTFDAAGVHAVWAKALIRRTTDPEGAITVARTPLETVCKHVLDQTDTPYEDRDDLPELYGRTAQVLNLAPSQHSEEAVKSILG